MQRAATILLVLCTSVMLGKAPCCRIHDFSGPIQKEVRGPGQHVCPCCERPGKHRHGPTEQRFTTPCACPPLIASIAGDADSIDLPLALPIHLSLAPLPLGEAWNGLLVRHSRAPPDAPAALSLPLLL